MVPAQFFLRSGRITYGRFFGLWLNRKRSFYRKADAVCFGVGIALGSVNPGSEFYESVTEGGDEAALLRAKYEAFRKA